jgi:hypothetical protein
VRGEEKGKKYRMGACPLSGPSASRGPAACPVQMISRQKRWAAWLTGKTPELLTPESGFEPLAAHQSTGCKPNIEERGKYTGLTYRLKIDPGLPVLSSAFPALFGGWRTRCDGFDLPGGRSFAIFRRGGGFGPSESAFSIQLLPRSGTMMRFVHCDF